MLLVNIFVAMHSYHIEKGHILFRSRFIVYKILFQTMD